MKPAPLLLLITASILGNLALAAALGARLLTSSHHSAAAPLTPAPPTTAAPPVTALRTDTWTQLSAGGDAALIARLRAEKFPPEVVRSVVGALVAPQLADERNAIAKARATTPYWRRHLRWTFRDQKLRAAERALWRKENELTRQLWGDDPVDDGPVGFTRMALGNELFDRLPRATVARVQAINDDYGELISGIRDDAGGILLPEDEARLALLARERRRDLARLLAPDDFAALDLLFDPTALRLRGDGRPFKPTDDELRALIPLQKPFDQTYRELTVLTGAQARERAEARAALHRQVAALLGPQRFADYLDAVDRDWVQASRFASERQLPPAAIEQIVAVRADVQRSIDRGSRRTALAAEATERLLPVLGAANLAAYRDGPGMWLRNLGPAPAPAAPPNP